MWLKEIDLDRAYSLSWRIKRKRKNCKDEKLIQVYDEIISFLEPSFLKYKELEVGTDDVDISTMIVNVSPIKEALLDISCCNKDRVVQLLDLSMREVYTAVFGYDPFSEFDGPDLRDAFVSFYRPSENMDNLDYIINTMSKIQPRAKSFEEEFSSLVSEKNYSEGGTRYVWRSKCGKYIYKRSFLVPPFQQVAEALLWFYTKNPFLAPIEHIFEHNKRPILVFPYIEGDVYFETVQEIQTSISKYGEGLVDIERGKPLFFDGVELRAWKTSWRNHKGIPIVCDYGEYVLEPIG